MRMLHCLSVVAVVACVTHIAPAQVVGRYDMGSPTSPVASGFTAVTSATTFASTSSSYGWLSSTGLQEQSRSGVFTNVKHNHASALIRDWIASSAPFTFRQAAAPGRYACVVYLGDLGEPTAIPPLSTPITGMNITANGTPVITEATARLVRGKPDFSTAFGGYKRVAFLADVTSAGVLDLVFTSSNSTIVSVMGIEIYDYTPPPFFFSHVNQRLEADPGLGTSMKPFTTAFEAHDYAGARSALDSLPIGPASDLAKAWGLAWLQGWLTGAEADIDENDLSEIEALLTDPSQNPDSWPVVSLLADLRDFRLGELFTRTRGYTNPTFNPGALDKIAKNLSAGALLLEQIQDDVLDLAANPDWPDRPFYPKAAYLQARSMYGRDTRLEPGDANQFLSFTTQVREILEKIRIRTDPSANPPSVRIFPQSVDAAILAWYVHQFYQQPDGPLAQWNPTVLPPTFAPAWFAPLVDTSISGFSPPTWALEQRRYARLQRNVGVWWMENRLIGRELGGGDGDDVEAAAALGAPAIVKAEGSTSPYEVKVKKVLDGVLFESAEVDPDQGFVDLWVSHCDPGVMDPEHAGEFTSYPLFFLMPTFYGDPRYIEYAMRTIRNFDEPVSPSCGDTSWTGFPPWSNWRHFKAFRLGARGYEADDNQKPHEDMATTEIMKDITPGFALIDYNGSPTASQYWYELAQGWAEVAMNPGPTSNPKPVGIFPVGVRYADGQMGGDYWWENAQQNGGFVGAHNYELYSMLVTAYRNAPATATQQEREQLLVPIVEALKTLEVTTPDPNASIGSPEWCFAQDAWGGLKLSGVLAAIAVSARAELVTDMQVKEDTLDSIVGQYGTIYQRYLNAPAGAKDKSEITEVFHDAADWLEHYWPIATTTVAYTDRIYATPRVPGETAMHLLFSTMSGSVFSLAPTFRVTWSQPSSQIVTGNPYAVGSDVAILLNEFHGDVTTSGQLALKVLLYNFGPPTPPTDLEMRIWRGLPTGDYRVKMGTDANNDDQIDSPPTGTLFQITGVGDRLVIPNLPSRSLQVLDLEFVGGTSVTPSTFDLGIGPEDLSADVSTVTVRVHNLGTVDFPGGTGARVNLFDASGTQLEGIGIPAIPAPVGLDPSWVDLVITPVTAQGQSVEARLFFPVGTPQITTLNDRAIRDL